MSRRKRKTSYDLNATNFMQTIGRRQDKIGDTKTLRMLQDRISRKTISLRMQEWNTQATLIRTYEDTLEGLEYGSPEYKYLERALEEYRKTHVEGSTVLTDLSGKVRTTREAKEVLRRLDNHTSDSKMDRMRNNYDTALRITGHDNLANRLQNLSDTQFLVMYYANSDASVAFLYEIAAEDSYSPLEEAWERAFELFGEEDYSEDSDEDFDFDEYDAGYGYDIGEYE